MRLAAGWVVFQGDAPRSGGLLGSGPMHPLAQDGCLTSSATAAEDTGTRARPGAELFFFAGIFAWNAAPEALGLA